MRRFSASGNSELGPVPAHALVSFNNRAVSWFKTDDLHSKRMILSIVGSNLVLKD